MNKMSNVIGLLESPRRKEFAAETMNRRRRRPKGENPWRAFAKQLRIGGRHDFWLESEKQNGSG